MNSHKILRAVLGIGAEAELGSRAAGWHGEPARLCPAPGIRGGKELWVRAMGQGQGKYRDRTCRRGVHGWWAVEDWRRGRVGREGE